MGNGRTTSSCDKDVGRRKEESINVDDYEAEETCYFSDLNDSLF